MISRKSLPAVLAVPVLMAINASGQGKPDFSGTWELTTNEEGGKTYTADKAHKETQIWVHRDPKLTIKMILASGATLELTFMTNGKTGLVGYYTAPDGTKTPVNGSAHWEGNRLVYEQELTGRKPGSPQRIIRTCSLETNGSKLVADQVYWMVGSAQPHQATWTWEKKSDTP